MAGLIGKREFLGVSAGLVLGLASAPASAQFENEKARPGRAGRADRERDVPRRKAKTTPLFKAPGIWPNALAPSAEGLWIGQQRHDDKPEAAWLVDWKDGRLLKTVTTKSVGTSGIAYGDGCVWMGANSKTVNGIFQTDLNSKTISVHQVPLGPKDNGGSVHGLLWAEGKLWIVANRLGGLLRVDPKTWEPEYLVPIHLPAATPRFHGIAWDKGAIWIVTGNDSTNYAEGTPGLAKLDAQTGALLEIVEFERGSCDPHGLAMHNGVLYSSDAGEHPGWSIGTSTIPLAVSPGGGNSPFGGNIFRIDFV